MSRPLPETHESRLKTVLGIEQNSDLPQDVVDLFWQAEKCCRTINGSGVSDDILIILAVMSGAFANKGPEPFSEVAKRLKKDDLVEVLWRGEYRLGNFVSLKNNMVIIRFNDDTEKSRGFRPSDCRLPVAQTAET